MKSKEGFTLLELIAVLSISAVVAVWASGFFGSQLTVYRKHMQLYQAESMGDAAAFKITSRLEQSVSFRIDPEKMMFCIIWKEKIGTALHKKTLTRYQLAITG